ncbi:hypothetical protein OE88DRAFT_1561926 [Heliocybe sulcata]|uniref:Fungal-type protein kinase domain-containing protein n=1 Tax=Heliocybe sulcata TaxID=5364 RepID=A0A5C3NCE7_9AGAM|nr:hypothetical protein OE88DRAFT_1561926 [Heliocybe sulcata]
MAHALLTSFRSGKPVAHLYEYDVESFAYVGLWICARYDKGKVAVHDAYRDWTAAYDPKLIAGRKRDNLTDVLPSTDSHSGHFMAICQLAWQAEKAICKARRRRFGAQLGEQVEPAESPGVYFERLCRMLNETVEAMDPKYGEYIQRVAEVMMKDYKVPEELQHYLPALHAASTGAGQINN